MRAAVTYRGLLILVALLFSGCASHYIGSVVDTRGRPVAHARVEGQGWHGTVIFGEGPVTVSTVADADGRFMLVTGEYLSDFTAASPDFKHHGRFSLAFSMPPIVIVVK